VCVRVYERIYVRTYIYACIHVTMPVAEWTKKQVCNCLIVGIAGSNPGEGMDVRLLRLLCVV
jgi:hypothetical protein